MNGRDDFPLEDDHHGLLDQFETEWIEKADPPDILEFCKQLPHAHQRHDLLVQLACIDLEFRVRLSGKRPPRTAGWYLRKLSPFGLELDCAVALGKQELVVRSFWGDAPRIDDLLGQQFPNCTPEESASLSALYRQELDSRFPIKIDVSLKSEPIHHEVLKGTCEIGRQRSGEPTAPASYQVNGTDVTRVLIASRDQNLVSRRQLRISRAGIDQVEILPLSENVSIYIERQRLRLAQPSYHRISPLGLEVRFHDFCVKLRRSG